MHNDNLRLINWPYFDPEKEWVLHPDPVQPRHVSKLMHSGALFARKFEHGTSDKAWSIIEGILSQKVMHFSKAVVDSHRVVHTNTMIQCCQFYALR